MHACQRPKSRGITASFLHAFIALAGGYNAQGKYCLRLTRTPRKIALLLLLRSSRRLSNHALILKSRGSSQRGLAMLIKIEHDLS